MATGARPLPAALAGEDCLWYVDRNGSWHPGFNCEFFTFCCGTCHQRYCCRDLSLLITERQQKHCLAFRWAAPTPEGCRACPPFVHWAPSPAGDSSLVTKPAVSAEAWEFQERHLGGHHRLELTEVSRFFLEPLPGGVRSCRGEGARSTVQCGFVEELWQEDWSCRRGSQVHVPCPTSRVILRKALPLVGHAFLLVK